MGANESLTASANHLQEGHPTRPLTGRSVLVCLVAFFAVVAGVNAFMIGAAVSTFGGVETGSAYKAGVEFNSDIAAAGRQEKRQWQVTSHAERSSSGQAEFQIGIADAGGRPVFGLTAIVRLAHPTNARLDRKIQLEETGSGVFRGAAEIPPGQWTLVIDLLRGEERMFRSRNRIVLR